MEWSTSMPTNLFVPTKAELMDFIAHSNRIEGVPDEPGHPLFDDHLRIATRVIGNVTGTSGRKVGGPPSPQSIHRELLRSEPQKFPGEYRQGKVYVGGRECMEAVLIRLELPGLLGEAYRSIHWVGRKKPQPTEEKLWGFHHAFEHIHPFWDGNGRTGRLWMNGLRLACGYEWYTVKFEDRFDYYDSIRDWPPNDTDYEELFKN